MENKLETLSQEIKDIDFVINLSVSDKDVKEILLSRVANEFKDEFDTKKELVFYQDQVDEIIELAKFDDTKKALLCCALVSDEKIGGELENHFVDYFGSQGMIK